LTDIIALLFLQDYTTLFGNWSYRERQDIPLKERDEGEAWLLNRQAKRQQHTQEIIRLETALDARVHVLFKLTPAEIALIGESTKYRYGEV
jgi:hypothetical protein